MNGFTTRSLLRAAILTLVLSAPAVAQVRAPTVQYTAPSGVAYRSQKDTGAVLRAQQALDADPKNVDKIIALGVAQSGVWQFREAIATFTKGMAIAPRNALLYRWRGHRYISVREFDKAQADLAHGLQLDSTVYGLWYHLGVLRFLRGDFSGAATAFARAQPIAPDPSELAGSTDWLWMSLQRAGRAKDAATMLARYPDSVMKTTVDYAYTRRLRMYRGDTKPEALFTPADTAQVQNATLSFGLGNWYMVHGDSVRARAMFERAVKSGGWPGFGFIVSEAELRRMKK